MKVCASEGCGKPLLQLGARPNQKFCSPKCKARGRTDRPRKMPNLDQPRTCRECQALYWPGSGAQKVCSPCYGELSLREERALAAQKGCFNCASAIFDARCASRWRCSRDEAMQCKPWADAARHKPREAVSA